MSYKNIKILLSFMLSLYIYGCSATGDFKTIDDLMIKQKAKKEVKEIYLTRGDEFYIRFTHHRQFDLRTSVLENGKVSLPLIGIVEVAGITVKELTNKLQKKYEKILRHPEIIIVPRYFINQKVFLGGEIRYPGLRRLTGKQSLLQTIMAAGGPTRDANIENTYLIRIEKNKKREVFRIDLNVLMTQTQYPSIFLKSGDIIYIPQTPLSNIADIFTHIRSIIPYHFGLDIPF